MGICHHLVSLEMEEKIKFDAGLLYYCCKA